MSSKPTALGLENKLTYTSNSLNILLTLSRPRGEGRIKPESLFKYLSKRPETSGRNLSGNNFMSSVTVN